MVLRGKTFMLSLVGKDLETVTRMKFTTANNTAGGDCKGADGAGHHQSRVFPVLEDPLGQSGDLSLVQISPDTVLSLVEPYYAGTKVYAITTHLKTSKMSPTKGILLELCFYGIRTPIIDPFRSWKPLTITTH